MCKDKIVNLIQDIVNITFKNENASKRRVTVYGNRILFACPFCGDSQTNTSLRRGNLYIDRKFYKCYNGGCEYNSLSLINFFKNFGKLNNFTFEEIEEISKIPEKSFDFQKSVDNNSLIKISVPRKFIKLKLKLIEYKDLTNNKLIDFIKNRKLEQFSDKFLFNEKLEQIYVLNTNSDYSKILSIQIRNLNPKYPKYVTINWISLIEKCGLIDKVTLDPELIEIINNESLKFGILTVDFKKEVFITEGPIDSFFLPNSLSSSGISRMPLLDYIPDPYFIFDNDKIGKKTAEELIKKNKNVFLWDVLLEKFEYKNIKDINDLFLIRKFNKKELLCYFSKNPLDLMMI